jgi:hypothetical protein
LRDQLMAELKAIASSDDATTWAHRILSAKNSLIAVDARQVEDAFQARLAVFGTTADTAPSPVLSTLQPSSSVERRSREPAGRTSVASGIDKSQLEHPEPRRFRDRNHVKFVAKQPCLVCGRMPSDAHHLRFAQHRALGRKVSDEFIVPLCRGHHREAHRSGDEASWWSKAGIDPIVAARTLWLETHPLPAASDKTGPEDATSLAAIGTGQQRRGKRDRPTGKQGQKYRTKPINVAGPQ